MILTEHHIFSSNHITLVAFAALAVVTANAQGRFEGLNLSAPALDWSGQPAGPGWFGQYWIGGRDHHLLPVGKATPIISDGIVDAGVIVTHMPPGPALVKLLVWNEDLSAGYSDTSVIDLVVGDTQPNQPDLGGNEVVSTREVARLWQTVENIEPELDGAIRETLEKPEGEITVMDMESLASLDASSRGIASVVHGLELARFLTDLNLSNNQLTSLSLPPIVAPWDWREGGPKGLSNLTSLNLSNNRLTNFTLPIGLSGVATLDLSNNHLVTMTIPDWSLTCLTTLNLSGNRLTRLRLPMGLDNLKRLDVSDSPIEELAVPIGFDLENLAILGFEKSSIAFYVPLGVARVGDNIEVSWARGVLQSSDTVRGTWNDVSASSPFVFERTGPQQFFRVKPE